MARKTVGHIELIWRCPRCGTTNPGPQRTCLGCGAAQPPDVQFEQPVGAELIQDEAVQKEAESGPDIHCPYCGTRNPAGSQICQQCGGDLVEGEKRAEGQVLGAYTDAPPPQIACPRCGTLNPNDALHCSQCNAPLIPETVQPTSPAATVTAPRRGLSWAMIVGLLGLIVLCGLVIAMLLRGGQRNELVGVVEQVRWERAIPIEALVEAEYRDWRDEIPADATIGVCQQAFRYESSEPQPNSEEVCGTPYTVDEGSGYAEVVQDCVYRVYAESCTYQMSEWRVVDTITTSGTDYNPQWPTVSLAEGQRQGQTWSETYTVWLEADGTHYAYQINELDVFQSFQPGSQWTLLVNGFGDLVGVEQ
jgi:predicted nucleic acid-binding Zn ribbon protein